MENFEALSDNEIRDRLKKYGLPIIPITVTTRKVLIKRLVEAVSGNALRTVNKARRETVHVPKQSIADDSESDAEVKRPSSKPKPAPINRRATIAAPQPAAVVEKPLKPKFVPTVVVEKLPTIVPSAKAPALITPSKAPKPIVAALPEQSDDDMPVIKPNRRTSRSPSLGKSTVVTTSYKHTIEPLHEQSVANDDDDVILVNDEDSDPGEYFVNKAKDSRHNFTTSTLRSTIIGDKNASPSRRTTYDTYRSTIGPGPTLTSEFREQAKDVIAANDSLFRRRHTTNTPAKPQRELNGGGSEEEEDPLKKVDTPFLSNFTRRLAQLKAEPLANLNNTFGDLEPSSTAADTATSPSYRQDRDYYRQSYAGRPSLGRSPYARTARTMVVPQEPSAWKKLESKIRWPLIGLVGLFVCVFIYVFLFTN